ncbi:hypothetical protein LAN29_22530, partial [Mycobacterium tuberculosis]|nr:hypothetical protein [Mycobacterium tuberculosis]
VQNSRIVSGSDAHGRPIAGWEDTLALPDLEGKRVVVLGGGYTWNPEWAPSSNLINNSLPRLTEGIRLWPANPGSKMIFTGAAAKTNPVSTAGAGARVA